jgi:integrase
VHQIGIRSVDPEEKRLIKTHKVDVYDMRYIDENGMKRTVEAALAGIDVNSPGLVRDLSLYRKNANATAQAIWRRAIDAAGSKKIRDAAELARRRTLNAIANAYRSPNAFGTMLELWWLLDRYAPASASVDLRRARQFLKAAVRRRLIAVNPFADVPCGPQTNDARIFYVSVEIIEKVIAVCPDHDWRLIFALPRYGGLRFPSEVEDLKWSDIDWENSVFTVHEKKVEHHPGRGRRAGRGRLAGRPGRGRLGRLARGSGSGRELGSRGRREKSGCGASNMYRATRRIRSRISFLRKRFKPIL